VSGFKQMAGSGLVCDGLLATFCLPVAHCRNYRGNTTNQDGITRNILVIEKESDSAAYDRSCQYESQKEGAKPPNQKVTCGFGFGSYMSILRLLRHRDSAFSKSGEHLLIFRTRVRRRNWSAEYLSLLNRELSNNSRDVLRYFRSDKFSELLSLQRVRVVFARVRSSLHGLPLKNHDPSIHQPHGSIRQDSFQPNCRKQVLRTPQGFGNQSLACFLLRPYGFRLHPSNRTVKRTELQNFSSANVKCGGTAREPRSGEGREA